MSEEKENHKPNIRTSTSTSTSTLTSTLTPEQFAAVRKAIIQANEMRLTGGVYDKFIALALMKIPYR